MNRKQFIQSHGATCKNWNWSWSFVNNSQRSVIFGAWDRYTNGKLAMILSDDWKLTGRGHKSKAYPESRGHLRLIEESSFRLFTFPMEYSDAKRKEDTGAPATIGGFTSKLTEKKLIRIGNAWYASDSVIDVQLAEELPIQQKFVEGARFKISINAYERNAKARAACIAHHGCTCAVCGFNFGQAFGSLGEGFIHVHHLIPIGEVGEEYEVDPIKDLIPVCPNCHAMIHRAEPPISIEQLRKHLQQSDGCQPFHSTNPSAV